MAQGVNGSVSEPGWKQNIEARCARADYYFKTVLRDQNTWYSKKSASQKRRHLLFALSVIVIGVVISILQIFETWPYLRYATAILGGIVSLVRGLDGFLRPAETWQSYRKASEGMKREYRLYVSNADTYTEAPDEEAAYRLLVQRVETVIAEEQQLFWEARGKSSSPEDSPGLPEPNNTPQEGGN